MYKPLGLAQSWLGNIISPRNSIPLAFTPSKFYNWFLHVLDSHVLGKNKIETMNTRQICFTIIKKKESEIDFICSFFHPKHVETDPY